MQWLRRLYSPAVAVMAGPVALAMLFSERGRSRLKERFGSWNLELKECLWFHGASLGEMNGLVPLMREAKRRYPESPILATATSINGLERAASCADHLRLLPFDSPCFIRRALHGVSPRALIFSETEIWPALLDLLRSRDIPAYLVNARISDYSYRHYCRLKSLFRPSLEELAGVFASSDVSARRFIEVGAPAARVKVLGNAKYDAAPSVTSEEERRSLRGIFCRNDGPVLVLGSLRPGEEKHWFPLIKRAVSRESGINFIIAPRHKEKFEFFASELSRHQIAFRRRSQDGGGGRVVLLDTIGELNKVYSIADASFVGGTLVDIGGHNPLEPAMYGSCPAFGPYFGNVTEIVESLVEAKGAFEVGCSRDIEDLIEKVEQRDPSIAELGRNARLVWQRFAGATTRIMEAIPL